MPDLLAGTTILAQDTPPSLFAQEPTNEQDISDLAPAVGPSVAGSAGTFTAPTTGRVEVAMYARCRGQSGNEIFVAYEIYLGVDATGPQIVVATINNSISNAEAKTVSAGASFITNGLTPGDTYFARLVRWVEASNTGDIFHTAITVKPCT